MRANVLIGNTFIMPSQINAYSAKVLTCFSYNVGKEYFMAGYVRKIHLWKRRRVDVGVGSVVTRRSK